MGGGRGGGRAQRPEVEMKEFERVSLVYRSERAAHLDVFSINYNEEFSVYAPIATGPLVVSEAIS